MTWLLCIRFLDWFGHGEICSIHQFECHLCISWPWNVSDSPYASFIHWMRYDLPFLWEAQEVMPYRDRGEENAAIINIINLIVIDEFHIPCCQPVFKVFLTPSPWFVFFRAGHTLYFRSTTWSLRYEYKYRPFVLFLVYSILYNDILVMESVCARKQKSRDVIVRWAS